jgi:hypothetical protein
MRAARLLAAAAAAVLTLVAVPGVANAAAIPQQFRADSGDACRYGFTDGTLTWVFGVNSPLPLQRVEVTGTVADRPLPFEPTICRDDGYQSTVSFVAYAGEVEIDRQTRTANNGALRFRFVLGVNAPRTGLSRVVVQVCRDPILTLPPSYCGKAVTYLPPPIA